MAATAPHAFDGHNPARAADEALLPQVVAALHTTGKQVLARFSADTRQDSRDALLAAIHANDAASLGVMRGLLNAARPQAQWEDDEMAGGDLLAGEWWIVDAVEGNVNHIHGMTEWAVTAALVRDNRPVLAVVHVPLLGTTYAAVQGGGAFQDGARLRPSKKVTLDCALVGTGQARPGEDKQTYRRIGESVTAMLENALVVRVLVPATMQLIQVAAGRMDVFWQHSQVRSGLLAGALLVAEAGGTVSDMHGAPWTMLSEGFLAAAPALHGQAVKVLSQIA